MKLRRLPLLLGELDRAPPDFDLNYLSIDRYANSAKMLHVSQYILPYDRPDGTFRDNGDFV